jgi:hypothetical protein
MKANDGTTENGGEGAAPTPGEKEPKATPGKDEKGGGKAEEKPAATEKKGDQEKKDGGKGKKKGATTGKAGPAKKKTKSTGPPKPPKKVLEERVTKLEKDLRDTLPRQNQGDYKHEILEEKKKTREKIAALKKAIQDEIKAKEDVAKKERKAKEKKTDATLDDHDKKLDNHEQRLQALEGKKVKKKRPASNKPCCGDKGGLTKKNNPCQKRTGLDEDGRCKDHPKDGSGAAPGSKSTEKNDKGAREDNAAGGSETASVAAKTAKPPSTSAGNFGFLFMVACLAIFCLSGTIGFLWVGKTGIEWGIDLLSPAATTEDPEITPETPAPVASVEKSASDEKKPEIKVTEVVHLLPKDEDVPEVYRVTKPDRHKTREKAESEGAKTKDESPFFEEEEEEPEEEEPAFK